MMPSVMRLPWGHFVCLILLCEPVLAAEIKLMSKGPLKVTPGDIVSMVAEPLQGDSKVQWWSQGEIVSQSSRCEIDTSDFTAGDYRYDVIVSDDQGIVMSRVVLQTNPAPPLYVPQKISPVPEPVGDDFLSAKNGQWIIAERAGGTTFVSKSKSGKIDRIRSVDVPIDNIIYTVPPGAQAIIRRVGHKEQWLVSSSSSFIMKNYQFELLSGKAIWRKLQEETDLASKALIAGGEIEASGSVFIAVEITQIEGRYKTAVIRNYESKNISVGCGSEPKTSLASNTARILVLDEAGRCTKTESAGFDAGDPATVISAWSPWWLKHKGQQTADRWRVEWELVSPSYKKDELMKLASSAKENGVCADVLDLLGARQGYYRGNAQFLRMFGECQFDLGMYMRSLNTFADLSGQGTDQAWAAYMRARAYRYLSQYELALDWFAKAKAAGFEDTAALSREAAKTAELAGLSGQRLYWLQSAWIYETASAAQEKDWDLYGAWLRNRPSGAEIKSSLLMDSQALPINVDEAAGLPDKVVTSRSLVTRVAGRWWLVNDLSNQAAVKFSGIHDFEKPIDSNISFAARSVHDFGIDLVIGDHLSGQGLPADRWIIDLGARLGTGLSGDERQRDRMGWDLSVTRPIWTGLKIGVESSKYLDPRPNGNDVIDLDLERLTGAVDHSHLDLVFYLDLSSIPQRLTWNARFSAGQVDYRVQSQNTYDHNLIKTSGDISWILLPPRLSVSLSPYFVSRLYKNEGGSDQTTGINSDFIILIAPLWKLLVSGGVESRAVSEDPSTSWSRRVYGMGLSAEF